MVMTILGDYHTHTRYSDGSASVIEMVRVAKERGLKEIAITDHSVSKTYRGLKKKNFERYRGEVESARAELPVLVGVESNVVSVDGHIDVDDEMRKKLDILLFGVHIMILYSVRGLFTFCLPNLFFNLIHYVPKFQVRRNTEIVKRVIEKNDIDVWTHPNKYFKLDVVEVARTCAHRGTLIELSSKKISYRPVDFERMAALGCKFIINSDAHSTKRVGDTARAEEFLKNCDYNPACIINMNQTFTDYKSKKESNENTENNQERDIEKTKNRWRRWF